MEMISQEGLVALVWEDWKNDFLVVFACLLRIAPKYYLLLKTSSKYTPNRGKTNFAQKLKFLNVDQKTD
ncbi:hypothetical protein AC249_AIPGENE16220 [Exaiptasia diaphana]|nr:hypothetical protein AC249_AIPGENE16220 [Exaiptasia diaphana]